MTNDQFRMTDQNPKFTTRFNDRQSLRDSDFVIRKFYAPFHTNTRARP